MDPKNRSVSAGTAGMALAAGAALASAAAASAAVKPKAPGETRVVALFGLTERCNGIAQEMAVRRVFDSKRDWRFLFVRGARLFTPALLRDADLFIVCRGPEPDPVDLFGEDGGIGERVVPGGAFWTDANVAAIRENVERRGMGLLAMQATVLCGHQPFLEFIDVAGIAPHNPEPVWYTRFNPEHPITRGAGKFAVMNDEQPLVLIKSPSTATLFESTAVHEKRQGVSGWALERGRGRVAGLLPGSTGSAFGAPEFRNLVWRSAHWAMRRDIPAYPEAENRYYTK